MTTVNGTRVRSGEHVLNACFSHGVAHSAEKIVNAHRLPRSTS